MNASSPTNRFSVVLGVISVGTLITVTVTVVEFIAYIMPSPTVIVIIAVPSPTAVTRPFSSTVATDSSLDV